MSTTGAPLNIGKSDFQLPYTRSSVDGQNGRVNLMQQDPHTSVTGKSLAAGFRHSTGSEASFAGDMLRGNWEKHPLADAYFTRSNLQFIQASIRKEVYRLSGPKKYEIDDQSVDDLKMIMRAMYLQYAKNNPFDIQGQVAELNDLVIKWSAPRILSEIDQYQYYLKDISHLPVPLEKPLNMSSAGTRSLPFKVPM